MKDALKLAAFAVAVAAVVASVGLISGIFMTSHHSVLVHTDNFTGELVLELWEADPEYRVWWYQFGSSYIGDSSYVEVILSTRRGEGDRAREFLDSLDIEYEFRTLDKHR